MNALIRLLSLGAQDADRRVAAALAPSPLEAADRYLWTSRLVTTLDRATRSLESCWRSSEACRIAEGTAQQISREPQSVRYQAIAVVLLTAAAVHVGLTLMQGPRVGWYWAAIPVMTATFAILALAGSRSTSSTH